MAESAAAAINEGSVHGLDSGQITLGTGFLVQHAARLAAGGAGLEEIVASVQELAARSHSFAALDTLEYLRRGGRGNLVMFSLGTILQLKPILKMHTGKVVTDRARTSNGAIHWCACWPRRGGLCLCPGASRLKERPWPFSICTYSRAPSSSA